MPKTAFIGLGNMGLPMASNLARKRNIACFDLLATARSQAKKAGLNISADAASALRGADAVITMLPEGAHVRQFYAGAMQHIRRGALLADCSTTAPEDAKEMARIAAKAGMAFVDAPVSGGIGGARAGSLSFLVGGSDAHFRRARPLLAAMGKNIFHAGPAGAGQAAKLCNNMLLSIQMIGTCEALALGEKMGLSGAALSDIMKNSSGGNWVLEKYNPLPGVMPAAPASRKYSGGFATGLMIKDSELAMRAAQSCGASTPLGALANQIYRIHRAAAGGDIDFSSVIGLVRLGDGSKPTSKARSKRRTPVPRS